MSKWALLKDCLLEHRCPPSAIAAVEARFPNTAVYLPGNADRDRALNIEWCVELEKAGHSPAEIVQMTGFSRPTIKKYLG